MHNERITLQTVANEVIVYCQFADEYTAVDCIINTPFKQPKGVLSGCIITAPTLKFLHKGSVLDRCLIVGTTLQQARDALHDSGLNGSTTCDITTWEGAGNTRNRILNAIPSAPAARTVARGKPVQRYVVEWMISPGVEDGFNGPFAERRTMMRNFPFFPLPVIKRKDQWIVVGDEAHLSFDIESGVPVTIPDLNKTRAGVSILAFDYEKSRAVEYTLIPKALGVTSKEPISSERAAEYVRKNCFLTAAECIDVLDNKPMTPESAVQYHYEQTLTPEESETVAAENGMAVIANRNDMFFVHMGISKAWVCMKVMEEVTERANCRPKTVLYSFAASRDNTVGRTRAAMAVPKNMAICMAEVITNDEEF